MTGPKAELAWVGQDGHRLQDSVQIEQRLAHPHEDDVREIPTGSGQAARGVADLVDDLRGLEVAPEAQLSRGAERATNGAAGLARDAKGVALAMQRPARPGEATRWVVHEHRFDERPVREQMKCLLGQAGVGKPDFVLDDRVDAKSVRESRPEGGGQSQHLLRRLSVLTPDGVPDLSCPIGRLAFACQPLFKRSIGETAQTGTSVAGNGARIRPGLGLKRGRDDRVAGSLVAGHVGRTHRAAIIACRVRGRRT